MSNAQQQVDGIEYARTLLVSWGEWMRRLRPVLANYRGSASFVRGGAKETSDGCEMPDHIAIADRILAQLKGHNATLFWVLAYAYWMDEGQAVNAAKAGVSEATYKIYRARAEEFVVGCLITRNLLHEKKC